MNFYERRNQKVMNLLTSYSRDEDLNAEAEGHKFLGAAYDSNGKEIHLWELVELSKFHKDHIKEN